LEFVRIFGKLQNLISKLFPCKTFSILVFNQKKFFWCAFKLKKWLQQIWWQSSKIKSFSSHFTPSCLLLQDVKLDVCAAQAYMRNVHGREREKEKN
jgi:hypothetical protein